MVKRYKQVDSLGYITEIKSENEVKKLNDLLEDNRAMASQNKPSMQGKVSRKFPKSIFDKVEDE